MVSLNEATLIEFSDFYELVVRWQYVGLSDKRSLDWTRKHSSRMRTTHGSSCPCGGICLSACWDTPPIGVGLETPPGVGLETPPGVGLETPLVRPLNFPPGCGPWDLPPYCKACWNTTCYACWDTTTPPHCKACWDTNPPVDRQTSVKT